MGKRQFIIPTESQVDSISKSGFIVPKDEEIDSILTQKKNPNEKLNVATGLSGMTNSTDGDSDVASPSKPMSLSFMDAMSYNRNAPEKSDYEGLSSLLSAPKLLASGTTRMLGNAFTGILSNMAKLTDQAKTLGLQAGLSIATGSLEPLTGESNHDRYLKAIKESPSGGRDAVLNEMGTVLKNTANEISISAKKDLGWADEDMNKGFSDFVEEGSIGKAIGAAYVGVVENIPQQALLATLGVSNAAVFAGGATLGTAAALTEEYEKDKDISFADAAASIGKGIIEGGSEMLFKTDITMARQLGKSIFKLEKSAGLDAIKNLIKEEGVNGAKQALMRDGKEILKKTIFGGAEEGLEEVLSTIGDFTIDTARSGEWNDIDYKRLLKQGVDSFVIGFASGGTMSGLAATAAYKPLEQDQQKKIEKFMEIANDETLSKDVRDIAKKQAEDIEKYDADRYTASYNQIAALPLTERVKAAKVMSEIQSLESEKKDVKDLDVIKGIDETIASKNQEVQTIIDDHKLNLADEIVNNAEAIDGKVAFGKDSQLTVAPDTGYVFHFDSQNEIPAALREVEPISSGKVEGRDKAVFRVAYTGQDLINAGLANQAPEVSTEQVSAATTDVTETANTVQELMDKAPQALEAITPSFQEQEGKTVAQQIAEQYHSAKETNTNQEFVQQVDEAIKTGLNQKTMAAQPVVAPKPKRKRNVQTLRGMKPTEGVELTDNIVNDFTGVLGKMSRGTKQVLQNYVKALRSVRPEAKVFYYEDSVAMEKGLKNSGFSAPKAKALAASSGGLFTTVNDGGEVIIHVNRQADISKKGQDAGQQSNIILAHEIVHATLLELARTNPSEFQNMRNSLLDMLAKDESANAEIQAFVERYSNRSEDVQAEEFLAQLGALLTREKATLQRSTLDKIKLAIREFLQKIAGKFRSKALMDLVDSQVFSETAKIEDTARFLEGLGKSLREGTDINMKYIKNLVKGSKEYQAGLRYSVLDNAPSIPQEMDANTLMDNDMIVEPDNVKQSVDEGNWTDNAENRKRMTKYMSTIKGMTEEDVWLAKAIAYNENKGVKLYTLKDKESVIAALENQLNKIVSDLDNEVVGQYEFANNGQLWDNNGGYLFTGWKPEYINNRINIARNDLNANEITRWVEIRDNANYHKQEVGVIREMQKNALLANIREFNGHNDFDPAFSYMLINSMIYNKYQVTNEETGEIKVFKYKQNQLSTTDATYATLQYNVAKAFYDSEGSKDSDGDIGIGYQRTYMNMSKLDVSKSKFAKYIDKKSSTGEGYWLKFPQGDNSEVAYDLFEIAKTSHKYPAKWCTGASDSTAASQLRGGDFYVFVDNKTGDARVAVRYNGNNIGEVRGLGDGQAILAKDSGIIEEISDTFEDGKAYESYSKTLNDIKKIGKDFFSKEEFESFQDTEVGTTDNLLKEARPYEFVKYVAQNFSLGDIARIAVEEDRSYGERDMMLQNIQNEIKQHLSPILTEMGESPYAIVNNYSPSPSDLGTVGDVQYIIGELYVSDYKNPQEYNFENLIYARSIDIKTGTVIADKLKSINYLEVFNGSFQSKALENVEANIEAGDSAFLKLPSLKKAGYIKVELSRDNANDFSSLEETRKLSFFTESGNITVDLPKLKRASAIQVTSRLESKNIFINLPSINSPINLLSMNGGGGGSVAVSINNNTNAQIDNIVVDGAGNNLIIESSTINSREINVFNGLVAINAKGSVNINTIDGTGDVIVNNRSEDYALNTDIERIKLDNSASLSIKGNQITALGDVSVSRGAKIDGDIDYIASLQLRDNARIELSAKKINKLKLNRKANISLSNNESIEELDLTDGSFAFVSSERIGNISGFYSNLLAKNLQVVNNLLFNLEDGNELFLPNLKEITNQLTLTGEIDEPSVDINKLEKAKAVTISQGGFNIQSLQSADSIAINEGLLEAKKLKESSKVILSDGSELYAPQLKSGYELQSLYGEFDSKESDNKIFDENGGREFKREPSDVKESLGDIGRDAREEHKRRTEKTAKQRVSEIYNKVFERNEEARQAFKKADMPFSMYSMYLKAGASPFAMKKFADAYFNIYGGLNEKQIHNLDSVIFLERVIAIDENFDNRGKKRPSHPDITDENGKRKAVNKESAIEELEAYEEAFGKEYVDGLRARAKEYFNTFSEILKYKYDNGLLSKETYELYKDYNYSPRKFLEHIVDVNGVPVNTYVNRGIKLGAEEIKNITTGSTDLMLINSADLLKMAMISAENRVFTNRALKFIFEEGVTRNNNIVKDAKYTKLKDGTIKLDKDGTPVVREAENGYVNKFYRDNNGKVYAFQMKSDIAKQFDDTEMSNNKETYQKILSWLSGAPILRNLAVTLNPFFGLINPVIDLGTQVMFSNTYKGAGRGLLAQSFAATKEFASITNAMIGMDLTGSKTGKKFGLSESAKQGEIRQLMEEYGVYGGFMTTQSEVGQDANKLASALSYYGNVTEIASKLAAYKFLKQTMLNDFAKENIDPATGESIEPNEKQMREIMISAAYHARQTLDYNRGGKWAKDMSQYVPFLNVSLQVKKIGGQYIVDNPADFIRKIQGGVFITAAITLLNLLISEDDYEKDKRIKRDKVDKTIIMLPFTLKDLGLSDSDERAYIPLPTPSFAKVFFNAGQVMAEQIYYDAVGKVNPNEGSSVSKIIENNFNMMAREIKGTFMPKTIQAMISYTANYDFWTQDKLTKDDKMVASQQGYGNENIMSSLKLIAQFLDKVTDKDGIGYGGGAFTFSPEKFQKSMEVITTSPTYNGLANTAYWMMDNLFQAGHKIMLGQDVDAKLKSKFNSQSLMENIGDTFGKGFGRLIRFTDPSKYNLPDFDANEDLKEDINLVEARLSTKKGIMYKDLMKIYDESKEQKNGAEFIKNKIEAYRESIKDPKEYNYVNGLGQLLIDRTKVQLGTNVDKYYLISTEAKDPRAKAYAIWKSFGDIRGNDALLNDLHNIGIEQPVIDQYRGILIQNNLIETDENNKPIYEEWYKKMIKKK